MSAQVLLDHFARGNPLLFTAPINSTAAGGVFDELVASPGAGRRLLILELQLNPQTIISADLYHTSISASNRVTGTMLLNAGEMYTLGAMLLPENTALGIDKSGTVVTGGRVAYAII